MTEANRERISALLDGELSEREIVGCVEQLQQQVALREAWGRYHLIGDVIRGEGAAQARPSIADRVREQVALEPAILAPQVRPAQPVWLRPVAGAALAASVAVLAVFSAPYLIDGQSGGSNPMAHVSPSSATYLVSAGQPAAYKVVAIPTPARREASAEDFHNERYVERAGTRWRNLAQPTVESKLNRYLVNHGEYATQTGVRGVTPYATFVGYDAEQ